MNFPLFACSVAALANMMAASNSACNTMPYLILPPFHGHPDKRFTIAIWSEQDDQTGREQGKAAALQR
ncbi:hypothetical protein, partial [Frateuria defendens]|uniref:hypothetical protein n=1 Tax=Frateuria defendens TaxID=2219559 RepID=UPI001F25E296